MASLERVVEVQGRLEDGGTRWRAVRRWTVIPDELIGADGVRVAAPA